jgi:hypothetical protein
MAGSSPAMTMGRGAALNFQIVIPGRGAAANPESPAALLFGCAPQRKIPDRRQKRVYARL